MSDKYEPVTTISHLYFGTKPEGGSLIDEMKTVAAEEPGEAVRESVEAIGSKACALCDRVAAQGEQSAKAVGREIEVRPVLSLLIAFAVGFCVSRLISR